MILDEAMFSDIPQLCELLAILFGQEVEFRPDPAKQEAALSLLINNPQRGRVFVIRDGSTLAGMVSVQVVISTACGGDVLLLEDLIVRPEYRNKGLGSVIMDNVVLFAKQHGYRRITLLTDRVNAGAQRFYKRHGFTSSDMVPYRMVFLTPPV